MNAPKYNAWVVYLGDRPINTVYFTIDCDREYVRKSLIEHDGMHPNIQVYKRG